MVLLLSHNATKKTKSKGPVGQWQYTWDQFTTEGTSWNFILHGSRWRPRSKPVGPLLDSIINIHFLDIPNINTSHETSGLYLGWHLAPQLDWYRIQYHEHTTHNAQPWRPWFLKCVWCSVWYLWCIYGSRLQQHQYLSTPAFEIQYSVLQCLCVKTTSVSSHQDSWGMCWLRDMVQ